MQPSKTCQITLPTCAQSSVSDVLHEMGDIAPSLVYWNKVLMQVLASSPPQGHRVSAFLPDDLPGQVNSSGSSDAAAAEPFSLFSGPILAQHEHAAGRRQQQPQQSRFDDGHASAEQQVPIILQILCDTLPCASLAGGPQA